MEELLLSRFLTYNELYIINKKNIYITVTVSECSIAFFCILFITDCINKFVSKCFTCYIQHLLGRIVFYYKMCYCLHKMRLTKSNTSIYNRGLYTSPGDSATAKDAAWARLLLLPTTNVSNV